MGSHFRVNATPVTFTFTLPPVSVTYRGPSWWNRIWRKLREITKLANLVNKPDKTGRTCVGVGTAFPARENRL